MTETTSRFGLPLIQASSDRIRTGVAGRSSLADQLNISMLTTELALAQVENRADQGVRTSNNAIDRADLAVGMHGQQANELAQLRTILNMVGVRVESLEQLADLDAGSVSDGTVASLVAQDGTLTVEALAQRFQQNTAFSLSPTVFGAVGDGIADDTAALQAWLDNGNSVLDPGATYRTTRELVLTGDHKTLIGNGATINLQGTHDEYAIRGEGNHVMITGVNVDGSGGMSRGGIHVTGTHAIIVNNRVTNFESETSCWGIAVVGDGGHNISNNAVLNLYSEGNDITGDGVGMVRAIYFHHPQHVTTPSTIHNNVVENILGEEGDGIHIIVNNPPEDNQPRGKAHVKISDNVVMNCSRRCVKLQASHVTVFGNTLLENHAYTKPNDSSMVDIINSDNIVIQNNVLDFDEHRRGINLWTAPPITCDNIKILDNTIRTSIGEEKTSILISGATRLTISGNDITGGNVGVTVGRATNSTVAHNTLHDIIPEAVISGSFAININSSCERVVMAHNINNSDSSHRQLFNDSANGISEGNVNATP